MRLPTFPMHPVNRGKSGNLTDTLRLQSRGRLWFCPWMDAPDSLLASGVNRQTKQDHLTANRPVAQWGF